MSHVPFSKAVCHHHNHNAALYQMVYALQQIAELVVFHQYAMLLLDNLQNVLDNR